MSSPSPDIQKPPDLAYPSPETADLLKHSHNCPCSEKPPLDAPKPDLPPCLKNPHHHIIGHAHAAPHVHPVSVHVHASPKSGHAPKLAPPSCNCHLQGDVGSVGVQEVVEGGGRKIEADDRIEVSPLPPALPPRPPPRPRGEGLGTLTSRSHFREGKN